MNNLVRIGDAARRLGVSTITLRRLEREEAIPAARRHPRTAARYWLESELEEIRQLLEPRSTSIGSRSVSDE